MTAVDSLRSPATALLALHLAGPVILLGLVGLIGGASLADIGKPGGMTPAELREPIVVPAGIMSAVAIALFAAIRVGGEYRYGAIAQRFLAAHRGRVLVAKLLTYAIVGLFLSAAAIGLGLAIASPNISAEGLSLHDQRGWCRRPDREHHAGRSALRRPWRRLRVHHP